MNREKLIKYGEVIEKYSWYEAGRDVDGSPYTNNSNARYFLEQVYLLFGDGNRRNGMKIVAAMVEERKKDGENLADPYCGNWHLWTVLKEFSLSRVDR